jgi:hypothetical protein
MAGWKDSRRHANRDESTASCPGMTAVQPHSHSFRMAPTDDLAAYAILNGMNIWRKKVNTAEPVSQISRERAGQKR